MPTEVNVNATLQGYDPDTGVARSIELGPDGDFGAARTGASRETTQLDILAALAQIGQRNTSTGIADGALSGHRVVVPDGPSVSYADSSALGDMDGPFWLTLGAAVDGAQVQLATLGPVEESSWNWVSGPVFLGQNGQLTQVPPTFPDSAFLVEVGTAYDPTKVFFNPKMPIALS